MLTEIRTLEDVNTFTEELLAEGTNCNPDDDYTDYINSETGEPAFTKEEGNKRNLLMQQCAEVCEKAGEDIYDLMLQATLKSYEIKPGSPDSIEQK